MPLNDKNGSDYWHEEDPKCPWCDYVIDIGSHDLWKLYDPQEGEHDIECPKCTKSIHVQVHCSFTFSTDEQNEEVSP